MKRNLEIFFTTLAIHLIIQLVVMSVFISAFDAIDALNKTFYLSFIVAISVYFSWVRVIRSRKE